MLGNVDCMAYWEELYRTNLECSVPATVFIPSSLPILFYIPNKIPCAAKRT